MPKKGFTGITVSIPLKRRLAEAAEAQGFKSIPAPIKTLLAGTVTGTGTNGVRAKPRAGMTGYRMRCFSRTVWCGGGIRTHEPLWDSPEAAVPLTSGFQYESCSLCFLLYKAEWNNNLS